MFKTLLKVVGVVLALGAIGAGGFVGMQVSAFNESIAKKYDIAPVNVTRSDDPAVLARGKQLAHGMGGCNGCHGENFGGGKVEAMGPLGTFKMPNITAGKAGALSSYSDAELARLIKHGVKKDGTAALFMPVEDFCWWPLEDVAALISFLRTVPPVDGVPGEKDVGVLGKVLDRLDKIPLDTARRIDHKNLPVAPAPAITPAYGAFVAKLCKGCHGPTLSGGPIPGAPPELPIPLNLTAHETGLKGWTFDDFERLMREGKRKSGQPLNPFMPVESTKNFSDTEMRALWAYLESIESRPFGER